MSEPSELKINFLNPLKCPSCGWESTFGARVENFSHLKDECAVCWLADWFKHEPPSSHCLQCKSEMEWRGHMMLDPILQAMVNKNTLCNHHKDFGMTRQ